MTPPWPQTPRFVAHVEAWHVHRQHQTMVDFLARKIVVEGKGEAERFVKGWRAWRTLRSDVIARLPSMREQVAREHEEQRQRNREHAAKARAWLHELKDQARPSRVA